MIDISQLYQKKYDENNYHCGHFAIEAYEVLTGRSVKQYFKSVLAPIRAATLGKGAGNLQIIPNPVTTCVAIMIPYVGGKTHVGIWHDGQILHIAKKVKAELPAVLGKQYHIKYYDCIDS